MGASGDPPKWVTLVLALGVFLILFLATYFGAAFLGGVVCGASERIHLPWASFNCKHGPWILLGIVYLMFLFSAPSLLNALRTAVKRVCRLTIVGGGRDSR
jgi:amino acid transporter